MIARLGRVPRAGAGAAKKGVATGAGAALGSSVQFRHGKTNDSVTTGFRTPSL